MKPEVERSDLLGYSAHWNTGGQLLSHSQLSDLHQVMSGLPWLGRLIGRTNDFMANPQPKNSQRPEGDFKLTVSQYFLKAAQQRKAIFMEDYLKKMQPVHCRIPKIVP